MHRLIVILSLTILLALLFIPVITAPVEEAPSSPVVEEVEEDTPAPQPWSSEEVTVLAKMVWGEARGVPSITEQAACVWCALNRVDYGYGSIMLVVTAPYQFIGYQEDNPVDENLIALCEDVLARWYAEKDGEEDVGRVLPSDYLWFSGDGCRNYFRNAYRGGNTWNWSLESPYES